MRTLIAVLLVLSAFAELFGTVTVAVNYARGAKIAGQIVDAFPNDFDTWDDTVGIPLQIKRIAHQLDARPVLTAGLVAYVVGALLGLAAGLLALYG